MPRRAFTLIEVIAVIVLIGMIAGAAAWSMTRDVRRATRADAIRRITHADRMTRLAAQRLGQPFRLRFNLDEQRIRRTTTEGPNRDKTTRTLNLPRGFRIAQILAPRTPDDASLTGQTALERHRTGTTTIRYSTAGRSVTYAVHLTAGNPRADTDDTNDPALGDAWLVFSGLTGQATQAQNRDAIEDLFNTLREGRPDPH